jgi:hypothetical protein
MRRQNRNWALRARKRAAIRVQSTKRFSPGLQCGVCGPRAADDRPAEGKCKNNIDIIAMMTFISRSGPSSRHGKHGLHAQQTTLGPILSGAFTC